VDLERYVLEVCTGMGKTGMFPGFPAGMSMNVAGISQG